MYACIVFSTIISLYMTKMNFKYFMVVLLTFCTFSVYGQRKGKNNWKPKERNLIDTAFVKRYADSLLLAENCLSDTMEVPYYDTYGDSKWAQMFIPFTFYHSTVDGLFGIGTDSDSGGNVSMEIDSRLMNMYLKRPDLVLNTQARIQTAGSIDADVETPLRREADFVDKMSPKPVEPMAVPVDIIVIRPDFWNYKGDYSLQFMQNCVSGNWYKGGESSYSMLGAVTMEVNYNNKQKIKWDNKLELRLGIQNTRTDTLHAMKSTEDLIRLTSKLGLQASKRWYYTVQMVVNSQFIHSYKSNDPVVYSDFLAPLNFNLSLGMDYNVDWINHRIKGTIHLAPLAYNLKYTRLLELSERLGIDAGRHTLHDFGSQVTADLTWQLTDILKWKTRLSAYTAYERMEFEWENTFVMQISKWMSAQLFVYPRFDDGVSRDGHHGYWQFKEFSSIGFTYSF